MPSEPTVQTDEDDVGIACAGDLEPEDAALVVAAKGGDCHAFEILVSRHQRRILAVALRLTRVRENAEDVVQQSLQKAFVHLRAFEGKALFSTWLTRITINEALMTLRSQRSLCEVPIDDSQESHGVALALDVPDSAPGPEGTYLQREQMRILFAAMKELTPAVRTAIELRELGEFSFQETAQLMGLSVPAVKGRVFHGRRKLRETLMRWMAKRGTVQAARNRRSRNQRTCN